MASLSSLVDATYKEPSTTIRLNGNKIRDVLSVSVTSNLDGGISSASVRVINNPGISPEAKIQIKQGYNGYEQTTFTGFVDSIERNEQDNSYTISARDSLKKAMDTFLIQEVKFGQDLALGQYYYSTYTSTDGGTFTIHQYDDIATLNANHPETTGNYTTEGVYAEAVVQWLLHMSGLAEGTEIQVDSTNFFIGDLNPAKFTMTSVFDAAMQIANLIGWRIYCDQNGVARFRKRPRQPGGYTHWRYSDKNAPYNIQRLTRTESNADLRNYVEVRGASGIRTVKRATSPYIGNTPYRGVLISEELIDTPGIADFMATRILQDLNRLKITVSLDVDGNPYLYPGSTIDVTSNAATGKFLAETVSSQMSADGGYKMTLGCAAYLGDTVFDEDPEPDITAAFVPTSVAVLGDPKYIVEFDGASSFSSRGAITNWTWDWPDGSHTSGDTSAAYFVFDYANISGGNSQNVTLHVTDAIGNTAFVTSGITAEGLTASLPLKYRQLYGALTTQAVGSLDGGLTWNTYTLPAISVAASNFGPGGFYVSSGHAIFGTSDGKLYKTVDCCVSMSGVANPGGQVTDVHIPEMNSNLAAAVTSTGKVLLSRDAGQTWSLSHTFAFPLREVKMGFTNFDYIEVVGSGAGRVYESFDGGVTWSKLATELNVLWATDGSATNYYAHTAGVLGANSSGAFALTFSGGASPSVPAATVMIDYDYGVMAVDSTGQHWVGNDAHVLNPTQNNSANITKHMIRDGELPMVVYYATASGISKSIDRNSTIDFLHYPDTSPPPGGWGSKVAYGPLSAPLIPGQLVYRGTAAVPALPGAWYISTASGWIYGCADSVDGIAAQTIGGFAVNRSNTNIVDYIECVAAVGTDIPGIAQLNLHSNWNTFQGIVRGMAFNSRPDSTHMLCALTQYHVSDFNDHLYAESISNFTTAASGAVDTTDVVNIGTVRHAYYTDVTSVLGEMVCAVNGSFFGPYDIFSLQFKADGSVGVTDVVTATIPEWVHNEKNPRPYKGIVRETPDDGASAMKICTGWNGSAFVLEDVSIPADDVLGFRTASFATVRAQLYNAVADPGKVYYATSYGVYSVDGYGQGAITQLLDPTTVLASGEIKSLNVQANSLHTYDNLTVIVGRADNSVNRKTLYSTDNGQTFMAGPDLLPVGAGVLYFVELPNT